MYDAPWLTKTQRSVLEHLISHKYGLVFLDNKLCEDKNYPFPWRDYIYSLEKYNNIFAINKYAKDDYFVEVAKELLSVFGDMKIKKSWEDILEDCELDDTLKKDRGLPDEWPSRDPKEVITIPKRWLADSGAISLKDDKLSDHAQKAICETAQQNVLHRLVEAGTEKMIPVLGAESVSNNFKLGRRTAKNQISSLIRYFFDIPLYKRWYDILLDYNAGCLKADKLAAAGLSVEPPDNWPTRNIFLKVEVPEMKFAYRIEEFIFNNLLPQSVIDKIGNDSLTWTSSFCEQHCKTL